MFPWLVRKCEAEPFQFLESLKMRGASSAEERSREHEFITASEIEHRQDNAVTARIARNVGSGVALSAGERRGASPLFQEG
jgi:threonine dehydratase